MRIRNPFARMSLAWRLTLLAVLGVAITALAIA
jgi:hypothetical protein